MKLDGRPMSGDIGRGATRETIAFAAQLARTNDRPPGLHTSHPRKLIFTSLH